MTVSKTGATHVSRAPVAVFAMLLIAPSAMACHSTAAPSPSVAAAPVRGKAFGDTGATAVHVLAFDAKTERATVQANGGGKLLVLAVVPGREIELLTPGETTPMPGKRGGEYLLDLRRIDNKVRPADADDDAAKRLEYDRCMARAAQAQRRLDERERMARRDTTGKGSAPSDGERMMAMSMENACQRSLDRPAQKPPVVYLPRRPSAERYLVVFNSADAISQTDIEARLATLSTKAPDVGTTIEAIGAGLYVGLSKQWSGYYVAW